MRRPTVMQLCMFIADYAARLLGIGATCIRLEHNVRRIASAFGTEAVMTIMPRHIHMTLTTADRSESYTYIAGIPCNVVSFDINARLSTLSWAVADRKVDFEGMAAQFDRICRMPPTPANVVLMLASVANGAFCRLFGGDWVAVATVILATMAGLFVKNWLTKRGTDIRVVFIICAFVSAVLGATDSLFGIGTTPDVAIGTSVLYLVPGIPFLNSFSDMLAGHYICAFSRFMHALILTASLSIGLCAAMMLMHATMFN